MNAARTEAFGDAKDGAHVEDGRSGAQTLELGARHAQHEDRRHQQEAVAVFTLVPDGLHELLEFRILRLARRFVFLQILKNRIKANMRGTKRTCYLAAACRNLHKLESKKQLDIWITYDNMKRLKVVVDTVKQSILSPIGQIAESNRPKVASLTNISVLKRLQ